MTAVDPRWNLNIHYHRLFLNAIPARATTALDVGCGDGLLSFDLAERGLHVTGIDPHAASIGRAQSDLRATDQTTFICGDLFTTDLEPASFDLVAASAVLHHIDARAGLRRMKHLVKPEGVVAVVGFTRPDGVRDRLLEVAGTATKQLRVLRHQYWGQRSEVPQLRSTGRHGWCLTRTCSS